jgi:hypothetical protein
MATLESELRQREVGATPKTMMAAVFVPTAFLGGITGQFYRQFALTIAVATLISVFVSLTLSPALSTLLMKEHRNHEGERPTLRRPVAWFFDRFNRGFEAASRGYGALVGSITRKGVLMLAVYAGLIGLTAWSFTRVPTGFIPAQDQGYLIAVVQLPPGASLDRTDQVVKQAETIILETPGVAGAVSFAGFSGATFTNASNAGVIFAPLQDFKERVASGLSGNRILGDLNARLAQIQEAMIFVVPPPPVRLAIWMRTGESFSRSMIEITARPKASLPEPGPPCTTSSIGRVGLYCAHAGPRATIERTIPARRLRRIMALSSTSLVSSPKLYSVTARNRQRLRRPKRGISRIRTATASMVAASGRSTRMAGSPCDIISDWRSARSMASPRTKPRINGADG